MCALSMYILWRTVGRRTPEGVVRAASGAEVAELADAHGSGPCDRKVMEVQVLSSAPFFLIHLIPDYFPTEITSVAG
jgi:hypothetical protein